MSGPTHTCPECGDTGARCIIGQYFECLVPKCKNFSLKYRLASAPPAPPPEEEDTQPGWARFPTPNWILKPGNYPPPLPAPLQMNWYVCAACRHRHWEDADDVANGLRCACGGTLHVIP